MKTFLRQVAFMRLQPLIFLQRQYRQLRLAMDAIASANAILIFSVTSLTLASRGPWKIPGNTSTLLIWFG